MSSDERNLSKSVVGFVVSIFGSLLLELSVMRSWSSPSCFTVWRWLATVMEVMTGVSRCKMIEGFGDTLRVSLENTWGIFRSA